MKERFTQYKKMILLLVIIAMITSFVGCGNGTSTPTVQTTNSDNSSSVSVTEHNAKAEISFEEMTVVDNDECTIKITGIDPGNVLGYTLKVYVENKSATTTYMVALNSASVNGIEIVPAFAGEVAPGKKANGEIRIPAKIEDVSEFTDIELFFRVYDSNNWLADPVALETVNIYPLGQENATQYVREIKDTDIVLVDNEYVTAIITGYDETAMEFKTNIYLVNKTDVELMFATSEVSINGYMVDPFWAASVTPGKCTFSSIGWFKSDLDKNGITTVEEIEFVLEAKNIRDLFAESLVDQVFKLNP